MLQRKYCFSGLVVLLVLFIMSCASSGDIVYDPDLTPDRTAKVVFTDSIQVQQYNGIDVVETWYPGDKLRKITATLPAETTSILFNVYTNVTVGRVTYRFKVEDLELNFDFAPGKEYTLGIYTESMGAQTFFLGKMKVGIAIWDRIFGPGESREVKNAVKSWELGETG